jgi:ABC-type transport system involved in multi-copper enzyme maturation permease subunit
MQVALDYVMSIVSFVGLVLAIFMGSSLITRDVDKKTIYTVITKPISRSQYVLGRFGGMALVLFSSIFLLTAFGLLSYYISVHYFNATGDKPGWILFGANFFFTLEMLLLLVAVAFFISSVATSSFLPLVITIAVYYFGQSISRAKALLESSQGNIFNPAFKVIVDAAYYVIPNLSLFDFKARASYNLPVSPKELLSVFSYGFLYISILLLLSIKIFNKRDIA